MIQEFHNLQINTNGQKLYEFTHQTIQWIREQKFNNGILNLRLLITLYYVQVLKTMIR